MSSNDIKDTCYAWVKIEHLLDIFIDHKAREIICLVLEKKCTSLEFWAIYLFVFFSFCPYTASILNKELLMWSLGLAAIQSLFERPGGLWGDSESLVYYTAGDLSSITTIMTAKSK